MKEFLTAATQADDDDVPLLFKLDGRECKAYTPTDGQIAVTLAALGHQTNDMQKIAAVINFFVAVLDKDTHEWMEARLMDRDDPLGVTEVQDVIMWLVEEWSGRPTPSPSASTRSQPSGGRKSKPRTTKSTSSRSAPASSST